MSEPTTSEPTTRVRELEDQIAALDEQVRSLRRDLWQSRDATIGATATAGSYRARNAELEMLIHQLRTEVARLDAALGSRRGSLAGRIARAVASPRSTARRLLR